MRLVRPALAIAAVAVLAGCSMLGTGGTPTPTPTATVGPGTPIPPTPTPTPKPEGGLPDGALLALSPTSGTHVTTYAVLITGTIDAGAQLKVNGEQTDVDSSGDFQVAVAIGPGNNTVSIDVTAADGTRTTRTLTFVGDR